MITHALLVVMTVEPKMMSTFKHIYFIVTHIITEYVFYYKRCHKRKEKITLVLLPNYYQFEIKRVPKLGTSIL
jgi:hypothetical protein